MPISYDHDHENEVTLFAETNFRNQRRRFGIKTDDRRRHMYVLGKTGMGKTTLLENMVLSDINAGHGVAYIDPHGDTAEKILDYIPAKRINDVVYFNPADMEFPVGFNILETANDEQKHLVASGLMGVFKKIWPDVWSPRMEYILLNCVLALLDYPGATLLGINRLLVDKEYRSRVIAKIRNPIVKTFWVAEFTSWSEKYATEAIAPVQNKVGQFLSASIIRNIVAQVKSTINPRQIMDEGKIFIVNLSKGKIGEDNMRLLGGMIVTKLQLAAMERVDIKLEIDRRDFYLYVDEFQNFATQSFANILSEARKYRLNLTVAHQYIEQLEEEVRDAVFGNVGTLIIFRVGAQDATYMETEFTPTYTPEDLTNLAKFQIYLKLMVDGVATAPFSANTLAPIAQRFGSEEKVIAVSRERYAEPRAVIEEKVLRWSGMEAGPSSVSLDEAVLGGEPTAGGVAYPKILTADEREAREALGGVPASMKPGTPEYARAGIAALEGEAAVTETEEYLRISPERLAAIRPAGAKKDKPKFKHTCTRCGKTWDMPVQLDTSRPMYCAECLPIVREDRKLKSKIVKTAVSSGPPADLANAVME
ncbi:MAG TPA: type IV secretion system DNA-binding domain-containing protein, partial [Candidatus Methylomirabilis sp.]|nr:type IV secretion system DNA-binding domain-containing protein [Candidatus Methylomirabilis sp.]